MAAQSSGRNSRNSKYLYFDPTTRNWNINISKIKRFQFDNHLNNSHNRTDTLYLIFEYIPRLTYEYIFPITISNKYAVVNDKSKLLSQDLMPKYISGASQLKDVSVNVFEINKLINIFGKDKFDKIDIYNQQLAKKDKQNQIIANKNNKNKNSKKNDPKVSKLNERNKINSDDDIEIIDSINSKISNSQSD